MHTVVAILSNACLTYLRAACAESHALHVLPQEELMILGFISLSLIGFESQIMKICIPRAGSACMVSCRSAVVPDWSVLGCMKQHEQSHVARVRGSG